MWDTEKDDFEQGCIAPGSGGWEDARLKADTVPALLAMIRDYVGGGTAGDPELELNACDETGRVDACGTTLDLNGPRLWANETELAAWKLGARECFYTVWTFYVVRVTTEAVDLETVTA